MTVRPPVFLCGFMGSGKSTLGKKTARTLNMPFIDLDKRVEEAQQKSIPEIFKQEGEAAFRELESLHLRKILQEKPSCLIALGGGTVCFNDNLSFLKSKGLLVYLELPALVLAHRLWHSKTERPLLKHKTETEVEAYVEDLLEKRKVFYEAAHLKVNALHLSAEQLHNEILALL
ncbi:MAG TPA: shikimate kinase [Bacteroidia bacterium]|nr:shikimate kinase [Bacteroidia bacterium]